jgi:hypothetical protein
MVAMPRAREAGEAAPTETGEQGPEQEQEGLRDGRARDGCEPG